MVEGGPGGGGGDHGGGKRGRGRGGMGWRGGGVFFRVKSCGKEEKRKVKERRVEYYQCWERGGGKIIAASG